MNKSRKEDCYQQLRLVHGVYICIYTFSEEILHFVPKSSSLLLKCSHKHLFAFCGKSMSAFCETLEVVSSLC